MKKHIIEVPDVSAVGIYAIHNKENGKYYIGSSVNIKERMKTHRRNMEKLKGSNLKIESDIKTIDDLKKFEFLVVETFPDYTITDGELRRKEQEYITKYKAFSDGYNSESHIPYSTGFYNTNELLRSKKRGSKKYDSISFSDVEHMTDYELVNALQKIAIMPESNYKDMTIYYIKQNILKRMNKGHKDS